ncbi:MAG: hypothetical protein A2X16_09850, partial [Bacteroidetes bacterium GWF2_39_10]
GHYNIDNPLCFGVEDSNVELWGKLPFDAINFENNHSYDFGEEGRNNTIDFMGSQGVDVLTWENSPYVIKFNGYKIALISLNQVHYDKDIHVYEALLQKIRFSKLIADITVLNIHWGIELQSWPKELMVKDAKWFIDNGVDIVIGHHPHVIIPPSVYKNRPVFYSLGNFIFDQKYSETKEGLIAICNIINNDVRFETSRVTTPLNSTLPDNILKDDSYQEILENAKFTISKRSLTYGDIEVCFEAIDKNNITIKLIKDKNEIWHNRNIPIIAAFKSSLKPKLDKEVLITLENRFSTIDNEIAPRPYVYEITKNGLVALWRGSALAWPLCDISIMESKGTDYLCVLHRGDNFIELDPQTPDRRIAFYIWNGFGFDMTEKAPVEIQRSIQEIWGHNLK